MVIVLGLLIIAMIYLVFYQFKFIKPGADKVHLPSEVFEEEKREEAAIAKEMAAGMLQKTWHPFSGRFKGYEEKISANALRRRLIKAGSPVGIIEFFIFKLLSIILVPLLGFIFLSKLLPVSLTLIITLAAGYFLPDMWLNSKIKKRHNNIRKDLPNVIDLLNLCVSGGLDFMLAVNRVVRDLRRCDLTNELEEVYRQTQMGNSRRDALKNFAWRVDMPEVHSFVRMLLQTDRMGTPMAEALKMQSEEIRVKRFQRGEAMALKAPIKLLFPLFVFILPVVLILIAGPILLEFSKSNIGF